jgi:hypothetical protein
MSDLNILFSGRHLSAQDIELIRQVTADFPNLTLHELANTVSELLEWHRPNGKVKTRECVDLLRFVAAKGWLTGLPVLQTTSPRGPRPVFIDCSSDPQAPVTGALRDHLPVRLRLIDNRTDRVLFQQYIQRYHYLGYRIPYGAQLRYFVHSSAPRTPLVGCLLFTSAAWKMAPRDQWIGWSSTVRRDNLCRVVNHGRFLILPWVRIAVSNDSATEAGLVRSLSGRAASAGNTGRHFPLQRNLLSRRQLDRSGVDSRARPYGPPHAAARPFAQTYFCVSAASRCPAIVVLSRFPSPQRLKMGLPLSTTKSKSSNPAAAIEAPPWIPRNEECHCGSGSKYKRCCLEHDEVLRRQIRASAIPNWMLESEGKLHQFQKYAWNVFALPDLLGSLSDTRRAPEIPTFDVVNSLFHTALLRFPSINALEGNLKESDFQKLIGRKPTPKQKAFSADVVANVLDKLLLDGASRAIETVIHRAERNKVFREGYGGLRCVAVDGWEPFSSYDRHCPHCLIRNVKVKRAGGELEEVPQYYHRYVVAMLLDPVMDVILAIEPVLNEEALRDTDPAHTGHEGELTAARRLFDSLHQTYGSFIDAFVLDALYANGPVMTQLDALGYGAFMVLKKANNEPFKEALALWRDQPPCQTLDDADSKEHIEFWDSDDIDTLDTYNGKIRVIRAVVTKPDDTTSTWCLAVIGKHVRKLSRRTALQIIRSRWHIENTAFHQWIQYWNLGHVFRHTSNALRAVLLIWALAFNLLQLFIYRRLKRARRPKDPTDTIRHIVEVMLRDLATLPEPIPWVALLDTG